jgi:hypothetical protein
MITGMRIALALLMALHGIAHLVGFFGAWRLAPQTVPYASSVLGGRLEMGDAGIRLLGAFWLLVAIGFWVASAAALTDRPWWSSMAIGVAIASLLLSLVQWPESRIGVLVNLVIIAAIVHGRRFALISPG